MDYWYHKVITQNKSNYQEVITRTISYGATNVARIRLTFLKNRVKTNCKQQTIKAEDFFQFSFFFPYVDQTFIFVYTYPHSKRKDRTALVLDDRHKKDRSSGLSCRLWVRSMNRKSHVTARYSPVCRRCFPRKAGNPSSTPGTLSRSGTGWRSAWGSCRFRH